MSTFDSLNRVTAITTLDADDNVITRYAYTLDATGRRASLTEHSGIINTYQYDANQRMVGFSDGSAGDGTQDITYRYNPDGIRTKTIIGGSSTDYIVDSNRDYAQVIAEQVNNVDIAKEYVFGDDLLSQNTAVVIDDSVDGAAEGADNGETQTSTAFYHYDSLGTTRNLSNDSGIITDDYFYEAFGDLLASTGTTDNDYLYTGEQYDAALDNYYLRARYYHQGVGRFTQQDTWMGNASSPITLNKYMYGNGDPLNFTDPTGNFSITELQTVNNIRTNLSSLQIDVGISLLDAYFDPENAATNTGNNAIALGLGAIGGPASFKILRMLSSKFRKACNSFTGDTLVMTENGFVAISDIQIGDVVVAFDEQVNAAVKRSVVHTIEREGEYNLTLIELESGEVIEATNNHPFYVKGDGAQWEWINAEDLRAGQLLKQSDGNELAIDSIASNAWESKVFNLTIEKDHNYFVGDDGVLAHNASPNQCEFLKVGSDANKVRQSLSLYTGRSINLGNQSFRISRGNMKHILERHHPRFWNGTTKSVQTFFDKNMSVIEIETAILAVISQNRAQLTKIGTNAKRGQVTGVYRGKQYKLGIKRGQIGQFYPLEHQ